MTLNISDICQPIFMVHFALTLALICSIMLSIQSEIVQYQQNSIWKEIRVVSDILCLIRFFSFFKFQSESDTSSLLLLLMTIIYACYAFGSVFIACELCEQTSKLFIEIDDIMCQLDWYHFPYEVQKMLPTILIMTQKPFEIECFGDITCSRDTFKKVSLIRKKTSIYPYIEN